MFNVLRSKLPRLAATKLTAQAPHWSERASSGSDSEDDCELFASNSCPHPSNRRGAQADRSHFRFGDRADGRAQLPGRKGTLWQEADKPQHQLASAANFLRRKCGGMDQVLVMNLGDPWTDPAHLAMFGNHVVDFPASGKHVAPGSDLIPLDILFTICSSMHSWLRISDKNVTFLHANHHAAGSGEESLKFVVGCYLAYLGDSDLIAPNQLTPPSNENDSHWKVNNKAFASAQEADEDVSQVMYSIGIDTNKINSYGGPARKRYAQYFLSILYTPDPPPSQNTPLAVDHVTITGLDEIKTNLRVTRLLSERWKDSLLHPVLVIYEKGKLKWKQIIPIKDSTVEVAPEVSVRGDCVVGLWFVKDCISTNDPPVVAFSFHSAFMESGVVRLSSGDLSCLGMDMNKMLDNPACHVSMELVLTYGESSDEEEEEVPSLDFSDYRNKWLAQRGGLPSIYATVANCQKRAVPAKFTPPVVPAAEQLRPPSPTVEISQPVEVKSKVSAQPVPSKQQAEDQSSQTDVPAEPCASESSLTRPGPPEGAHPGAGEGTGKETSTAGGGDEKEAAEPVKKTGQRAAAPPPPPPPPRSKTRRKSQSTLGSLPSFKSRVVSKTKSFFWDITPKQSGTVWSELSQAELEPSHLTMLETLFRHDDQSKSKKETPEETPTCVKKCGSALALSVGRANNVSIMMTRFKHFAGIDAICKAVLTGDGITDEELDLLSQIGPTEIEIRDLNEHKEEDLSIPEKILVAMTVIPRLRVKATCQLAIRTWEQNFAHAIDMLQIIKRACQQIRESKRLQHVFSAILVVGNTMNRGTSRGNAGGIKVESLSRLWDTRVSSKSKSQPLPEPEPKRVGTVPTAISQALEGPSREEKILTLLDFTAVIVHDKDVSSGRGCIDGEYLGLELSALPDAVGHLEDGITDLLSEVDSGFELLEKEFRSMTGKSWSSIESSLLPEMKIRHSDKFPDEQRGFLVKSHQFLIEAGGARNFLRQEEGVVEQHLASLVQWLGENGSSGNPRQHLKRIDEFAKRFDQSYSQLKV